MRLKTIHQEEIVPTLMKELDIKNVMAVPAVKKIVVNMGLGEATKDRGQIDKALVDLEAITGQKPKITTAKKAVASFKLREGQAIGLKVTLRGQRMYDFMEKFFRLVLPRMRDFQGLPNKSFDGRGNYTLGLAEQIIFPEIDYGKIERVRGLEISFITSTNEDEQARRLLQLLGLPFSKEEN